ncbi:hypothetical protein JX266_014111 [Neoarthrinium moseri]|nr:hypothetical protein JX266_014111 [Neoarthrinium moseri]
MSSSMTAVVCNTKTRDTSALTIPISVFQAAIHESSAQLHQWQVYADQLRIDNEQLRRQFEQLTDSTEEMRAAYRLQEEQVQGLMKRITCLESQLAECVLSDGIDYLPPQSSCAGGSTQTTPTYQPALDPSLHAYDEVMALVESYDSELRYPSRQKRKAEETLGGDAKRQVLDGDWPLSVDVHDSDV